jgi:fructose/tagatose bisphosphate aldolase
LGFSGIYLPHPDRVVTDRLSTFAAMGFDICRLLAVPAHLLFNESADEGWIRDAIDLGFGMVMFTDEELHLEGQVSRVKEVVEAAHKHGVAVEGELVPLPGQGGELSGSPDDFRMTGIEEALDFVARTGVDTFAVNVGQAHWHGRTEAVLDLERLARLGREIETPLALHGASSIRPVELRKAIGLGVRKVNIGSRLKQAFFAGLKDACLAAPENYNPYEIVGSGLDGDVLVAGRRAMRVEVERWLEILGSAGQAFQQDGILRPAGGSIIDN